MQPAVPDQRPNLVPNQAIGTHLGHTAPNYQPGSRAAHGPGNLPVTAPHIDRDVPGESKRRPDSGIQSSITARSLF